MVIYCYTDGACRGNGSINAIGSIGVSITNSNKEIIDEYSKYLGNTVNILDNRVRVTNNITEYLAFIEGLKMLNKLGENEEDEIIMKVDSKLVCEQVNRRWKINNPILKILHKEATTLLKNFKDIKVEHVLRHENKRADELANDILNVNLIFN